MEQRREPLTKEHKRKIGLALKGHKQWNNYKGCFQEGHIVSEETRKKMSATRMGNHYPNLSKALKGRKLNKEWKEKVGIGIKNTFDLKGRITPINRAIRTSKIYKNILKERMIFDDFRCVDCGEWGGKLEVNHIMEFSKYPRLRMEFNNLETLCKPCHKVKTTAFM